jgi:nicotinamide riboside kinase
MIISFTGAQSTGKTTLLNLCKQLDGHNYEYVDEVTRLVKRKYDVPINESGTDVTQLFIINQHIENMYAKRNPDSKGLILDRCILDGLVYTAYLVIEGKVSPWVGEYAKNVFNILIPKIDKIFYTWPGDVSLVDDGERSINVEFRNKIIHLFDVAMDKYKNQLENKLIILKGTVEERMEQIKMVLC